MIFRIWPGERKGKESRLTAEIAEDAKIADSGDDGALRDEARSASAVSAASAVKSLPA